MQENCYVVWDVSSLAAAIIDPGMFFPEEEQAVGQFIAQHGLRPTAVLCTHGHFDHIFGCHYLFETYGLAPAVHEADLPLMADPEGQTRMLIGMPFGRPMPAVGQLLAEGDTVSIGKARLKVIHTPGHTPGGVTFYDEEDHIAFTGDTLFCHSVGRTDLPGSSQEALLKSLDRLMLLPDDTSVMSGHGQPTTIGNEKRFNPYI